MGIAGTGAGLETSEFCRKEDPRTLEVLVGFVRVCRDEFLTFEVDRVALIVADIGVRAGGLGTRRDLLRQLGVRFAAVASPNCLSLGGTALRT